MTEQLALIEAPLEAPKPPKLHARQAFVLELLQAAGADGLDADEAGAAWCAHRGKHTTDTRCDFDGKNGNQVLRSLEEKGLARYRRKKGSRPSRWLAAGVDDVAPTPTAMLPDDQPLPF